MESNELVGKNSRSEITSICRETAKSLDMSVDGTRWRCEATELDITDEGFKSYGFYIFDKNLGREYEAQAVVRNEENADWEVQRI